MCYENELSRMFEALSTVDVQQLLCDNKIIAISLRFSTRISLLITTILNRLPMNTRQLKAYMKAAYVFADLSYCKRNKVGFVLVKDDRIISVGYNGTPPGEDNCCEHSITTDSGETLLVTNPNVIHAEINALNKLKTSPETITDTTVGFSTTAPCVNCAMQIVEDGLKIVYYDDIYRSADGIEYLLDHHVKVNQITP